MPIITDILDDQLEQLLYPGFAALIRKLRPHIDLLDRDSEDEAPAERRVTYLLSGGGAKGCFQAGALGFLTEVQEEVRLRPDLVCGTSVGALNGILTTENANAGGNRRIIDLIDIWLNLNNSADFFIDSPDLTRLDSDLPGWLKNLLGIDLTDASTSYFGGGYNLHPDEIPTWPVATGGGGRRKFRNKLKKALTFGGAAAVGKLPGGFLGAGVAFKIIANGIEENYEAAKDIRALFSFRPLRDLIRDHIDVGLLQIPSHYVDNYFHLQTGKTVLRMVSVDIRTGNICWVDNRGKLQVLHREKLTSRVYGHPDAIETFHQLYGDLVVASTGRRHRLDYKNVIIEAALSSAAIPVVFPPGTFYLTEDFDHTPEDVAALYDGGVKDVIPSQAAESYLVASGEAGYENFVVTVSNQPMFDNSRFFEQFEDELREIERLDTYDAKPQYWNLPEIELEGWAPAADGTNILDLAARAIALQGQEVNRTDPLDLLALNTPLKQMLIAPTFSVNQVAQIDVGLVRIALAYGWMRACDMAFLKHRIELLESGEVRTASAAFTVFFDAYNLSDLITRLRMNCWRNEMKVTPPGHAVAFPEDQVIFDVGVIESLRETKRKIAEKIGERQSLLSSFPYPEFPKSEYMQGETPDDWLDFELHSPESFWFFEEDKRERAERTAAFLSEPNQLWSDRLFEKYSGFLSSAARPAIA